MINFSSLWGRKKPTPTPKKPAKSPPVKGDIKDSPRARLIHEALALHRVHGAPLRSILENALKALENRKTLRDPHELERLLALVQAHRAMKRLFSGDLRRYLVLAGLRQWSGKEPQGASSDDPPPQRGGPRPVVARR